MAPIASRGGRAQHDRHLVQPQLPAPQRRAGVDHELHREPRDRHRARARRALVQSAHRFADGRRWQAVPAHSPAPAPEVPAKQFERGRSTYIAPPEDGRRIALQVDPRSERLQLLEPWRPGTDWISSTCRYWSNQGKTTTDDISPMARGCATGDTSTDSATTCCGAPSTRSPASPDGKECAYGRGGAADLEARQDYRSRGPSSGSSAMPALRRRQQSRACGALAPPARRRRRDRAELRPHSANPT